MNILDEVKSKMASAIEHLKNELRSIRTGRANPAMVDHILVEVYGSSMRIKDLASVSTPEPRLLLVTPFDAQLTNTIGKALTNANPGLVIVEANLIRIKIPAMTEETRKKMAKVCQEEKEKTKVSIRNIRRDGNELARKLKNDGKMPEDLLKKSEKSIQELTDKFCKEADEVAEKKEKEITTI